MAGLLRGMTTRTDEHRLTRIETDLERQGQLVLGGLFLMLAGALVLVKQPIDKLTDHVGLQNGRVKTLEVIENQRGPRFEEMGRMVENHETRLKFQSWLFTGVLALGGLIVAAVAVLK